MVSKWIRVSLLGAVAVLLVDAGLMLLCDVTLFQPHRFLDEVRWWPSLDWIEYVAHRTVLAFLLLVPAALLQFAVLRERLRALGKRMATVGTSVTSETHEHLPFGIRFLATAVMAIGVLAFVAGTWLELKLLFVGIFWSDGPWGTVTFDANWGEIVALLAFALASIALASGLLDRKPLAWRALLGLCTAIAGAACVLVPYLLLQGLRGHGGGGTGTAGVPGGELLIALDLAPVLVFAAWAGIYLWRKRELYIPVSSAVGP